MRDDLGRELLFGRPPERIVSLVPSETHTLFALGAGARVVGRTRYCVEPASQVENIPVVGGTKDIDAEAIMALEPDLILVNQEENSRPALEKLADQRYRIFVSFPRSVGDAAAHVARLCRMCFAGAETPEPARNLVRELYELSSQPTAEPALRAFVPIWMEPLMTFAADTFADEVLKAAGIGNAFAERQRMYPLAADLGKRSPLAADQVAGRDTRYPRITDDELVAAQPDIVLLPDEPHECTTEDKDRIASLDIPAAKTGNIHFVSGKDLFWPGAWLRTGLPRLKKLSQPGT